MAEVNAHVDDRRLVRKYSRNSDHRRPHRSRMRRNRRFTMSDPETRPVGSDTSVTRRQVLQLAATTLLTGANVRLQRSKKIIVAGAGIGGLSCAWELVRRGHDVTVVEASARTGGHVLTFRDGLD